MRLKQIFGFKIKLDAGNGFYVEAITNGFLFTITGLPGEFVVHKDNQFDYIWVVSEKTTGLQIPTTKHPSALTKYEAIANATKVLSVIKKGKFERFIEMAIKNYSSGPVMEVTNDGREFRAVAKV